MEELEGRVSHITFFNPANNYTIARIITLKEKSVTILGYFPMLNTGESIKVRGYWKIHEKFGEQFMVESFEFYNPDTIEAIEKYLLSGNFEGMRKSLVKKLVKKFGEDTLDVLDHDIEKITEAGRISKEDMEMLKSSWNDQRDFRKAFVFLQGIGINSNLAIRIYSIYRKDTEMIVRANPYKLLEDIPGLPFNSSDEIASQLGFTLYSNERLEAGIIFALRKFSDEGHTYYPDNLLITECIKLLAADYETIVSALYDLKVKGYIEEEKIHSNETEPQITALFLSEFYYAEITIRNKLEMLTKSGNKISKKELDYLINCLEEDNGIRLAEGQKQAIISAFENKVVVITGGPGTGKTTIIRSILSLAAKTKKKALLAAPTGRAAKRMSEATSNEAKTIHRLLEYNPTERCFGKNADDQLETDLVIIDECSMIDTLLLKSLLDSIPSGASLIMVGDSNQLPSVGAGNVLKDIIDSGVVPVVLLTEIFRQSRESMIVMNAHRINKGNFPLLSNEEYEDFQFLHIDNPDEVLKKIIQLCTEELPELYGYSPFHDLQVLSPMHKGTAGVSNLNVELQRALNFSNEEIKSGDKVFKSGDKVMQIRNNYQKEVFNGDIGQVHLIDNKKKIITVNFDGRLITYEYPELYELMLAYAISVHKSQGSEYPVIIMPVLKEHNWMLQRNLLYTGITRSKSKVILIGTAEMLSFAIRNNKAVRRYTYLKERLSGI